MMCLVKSRNYLFYYWFMTVLSADLWLGQNNHRYEKIIWKDLFVLPQLPTFFKQSQQSIVEGTILLLTPPSISVSMDLSVSEYEVYKFLCRSQSEATLVDMLSSAQECHFIIFIMLHVIQTSIWMLDTNSVAVPMLLPQHLLHNYHCLHPHDWYSQ